jgi:hypothetical protein
MALSDGEVSLVLGTGLALGALALVLSPLLGTTEGQTAVDDPSAAASKGDVQATAVDALREIEFDRETGKLSDGDYADLKQRYTREALAELRAADASAGEGRSAGPVPAAATSVHDAAPVVALDPVEAAIQKARANQRSCGVCGPRPEPDATYCSSCGRYLPGACGQCGASVELVGSRFCCGCGTQLAAA